MGQYCISKGTDLEFGFMGGLVGYYGYEMMEPVFEFPRDKDFDYPDSTFFFIDRFTGIFKFMLFIKIFCSFRSRIGNMHEDFVMPE